MLNETFSVIFKHCALHHEKRVVGSLSFARSSLSNEYVLKFGKECEEEGGKHGFEAVSAKHIPGA